MQQQPAPAMISLANGVQQPRVGLGTYKSRGPQLREALAAALAAGIRAVDTASIYKNEEDIAAALAGAGLPRGQVFITSKVSPYEMGTDKATAAVHAILGRLRTDYVDLLLMHWPGAAKTDAASPLNAQLRAQTWAVLERAYAAGEARAIGVSNFHAHHLQQLLAASPAVRPMVNQIEVHPRRPEAALRQACAAAGVAVTAYASLGAGQLLAHPVVRSVAARAGRTEAQVLLRWGLDKGCAVIPKSCQPGRVAEFAPAALLEGWALSPADTAALDALEDGSKFCWDASGIL